MSNIYALGLGIANRKLYCNILQYSSPYCDILRYFFNLNLYQNTPISLLYLSYSLQVGHLTPSLLSMNTFQMLVRGNSLYIFQALH